MSLTNARTNRIKPSATLAVKAAAMKLKAEGKTIYDVSTGEPDIDTPQFIKDACIKALNEGKTKYTDVGGILELREAIAAKLTSENKIETKAAGVVVTNGGKQAIYSALDTILEDGDEVIIPAPYWVSYPPVVDMCHGKPVIVECSVENSYKLTPEVLEKNITPKTRLLIINSPSNPTGAMYSPQEMRELGKVLAKNNVLVLSDEVYEKIVFGDIEFMSFAAAVPEMKDRTITINAFSKAFSMTGWRIGYATGPQEIISAMTKHQSQVTSNITTFAQYGALAGIKSDGTDFFNMMSNNFKRRLELALSIVSESRMLNVPVKPDGAFYLFLRIDELKKAGKISGSTQFSTLLMEKIGVSTVPGIEFGDDGAVRVATATKDEVLREGLTRVVEFADSL